MSTQNEIKPAAPAEGLDGGRCAGDAGFGILTVGQRYLDCQFGERIVTRLWSMEYRDGPCAMVSHRPIECAEDWRATGSDHADIFQQRIRDGWLVLMPNVPDEPRR